MLSTCWFHQQATFYKSKVSKPVGLILHFLIHNCKLDLGINSQVQLQKQILGQWGAYRCFLKLQVLVFFIEQVVDSLIVDLHVACPHQKLMAWFLSKENQTNKYITSKQLLPTCWCSHTEITSSQKENDDSHNRLVAWGFELLRGFCCFLPVSGNWVNVFL